MHPPRFGRIVSAAAVAILASAALLFPTLAGAVAAPRHGFSHACLAGRTVFHVPGVRAFVVVRRYAGGQAGVSSYKTFYVCRNGWHRPRVFQRGSPWTVEGVSDIRLIGNRLGFVLNAFGLGAGGGTEVGWIDLVSHRVQKAVIAEDEGPEPEIGLPQFPVGSVRCAIAQDGAMAVAGRYGNKVEWGVAELPELARSLGKPRVLYTAPEGGEGIDLDSIAIDNTAVSWSTAHGQRVSVAR